MSSPTTTSVWSRPAALLALLALLTMPLYSIAQNRKDLETKRKQLVDNIKKTSARLEATKRDKVVTLDRYAVLQKQIKTREQLINTLQEEVQLADDGIERAHGVLESLQRDLNQVRAEYEAMLRAAYRRRIQRSNLLFLLSSGNFNEAFRRWRYLRQVERYRKKQARLILDTQQDMEAKLLELQQRRQEKEQLLATAQQEQLRLNSELLDKQSLLSTLKTEEAALADNLVKQQEDQEKLSDAIESIIRREMAEEAKRSRSREVLAKAPAGKKAVTAPPVENFNTALSDDFQKNRGRLPWPVSRGEVSRGFGLQSHATIRTVQIDNKGIDILSDAGAEVYAIFRGTVSGVQFVPGYRNMVIIQHGNYYTVYSNLEEVFVRKGDEITTRQSIGRLSRERPEIHFEIWQQKQRMNPLTWVSKSSG